MKGRRIATGRGSIGHYLLLRVLERAGLGPKDVTIVFLSPGDAKAAFDSGSVDAWVTWGSYVGLAQLHDRTRILADGQGLLSGIGFEAASDGAIAGKHAELAGFLHRPTQAQRWEGAHKSEYATVLAKETGLPLDVALYTVSKVGRSRADRCVRHRRGARHAQPLRQGGRHRFGAKHRRRLRRLVQRLHRALTSEAMVRPSFRREPEPRRRRSGALAAASE